MFQEFHMMQSVISMSGEVVNIRKELNSLVQVLKMIEKKLEDNYNEKRNWNTIDQ